MTAVWSKYKQRLLPYLQYLKPRRPRIRNSQAKMLENDRTLAALEA